MLGLPLEPHWMMVLSAGLALALAGAVAAERTLSLRERRRRRLERASSTPGAPPSAGELTALVILSGLRQAAHRVALSVGGGPFISQADRDKIQALLVRAGFRRREAIGTYTTAKMAASLAGLSGGLALTLAAGVGDGTPVVQVLTVIICAVVSGLAPEVVVQRIAARRREEIRAHLPDAIDLMIITANAGHSLDVSLGRVAREIERSAPALGDELSVTIAELRGLSDRRQPLENLARRTDLKEVRSVTATLIQTLRYGTPLVQSLKALAQEMREARMLAIEEKAARLPALLSLPLMLFIMPAVFIVTAGPGVLAVMEAFTR